MPAAVNNWQEEVGPCHEIEVEGGSQDHAAQNQDSENLEGGQQPIKRNDPDDAMLKEDHPCARSIDETRGGNHHHEPADDKKDIHPSCAIVPTYPGRCGIDALAPSLECVEKHDE
jgi:hypothetical protein